MKEDTEIIFHFTDKKTGLRRCHLLKSRRTQTDFKNMKPNPVLFLFFRENTLLNKIDINHLLGLYIGSYFWLRFTLCPHQQLWTIILVSIRLWSIRTLRRRFIFDTRRDNVMKKGLSLRIFSFF